MRKMIYEFDYEINDMSEEVKAAKEQLLRALVHNSFRTGDVYHGRTTAIATF